MTVNVDVRAVHGQGRPALRNGRRRAAVQQTLRPGAGNDERTPAGRRRALRRVVGRNRPGAIDGVGEALAAGTGRAGNAVHSRHQLMGSLPKVQRQSNVLLATVRAGIAPDAPSGELSRAVAVNLKVLHKVVVKVGVKLLGDDRNRWR